MTTALEQQREDQALGAAWRRCEALVGEDGGLIMDKYGLVYAATTAVKGWQWREVRATPTEALTALAEALEARKEAAE